MLLSNLNLLATAPGGVARLRELILTLAVQGKLVPQDPSDEPASELLKKIRAEKDRLMAAGKIKRDKPLAEISEDEKPFELPQGWEWVRLGSAAKKITDGTHHSPTSFSTGDFKYLSAKNIKTWGIDLSDVTYVPASVHEEIYARCDPEAGDILFIKDGATTGILTINTLTEPFSLLSSVGVIKPSCGLTSEWLARVMRSPFFYDAMRAEMTGVAITRVTLSKLAVALVPLPPLAEQSRIVTRVEELMRLCDALEAKARLETTQHAQLVHTLLSSLTTSTTPQELSANWQRVATHFDLLLDRPEAVDALEQTILQLAVRGLLVPQDSQDEPASALLKRIRTEKDKLIAQGKIKRDKPLPPIAEDGQPFALPQRWEWVPVGDVVEMLNGYAFKSEWFKQTGTRLLRNVNVAHGHVDWSTPAFIDSALANEFGQFALNEGDIVLTLDRPIISTGLKLAILQKHDLPCLLLQRVARLSPVPQLLSQEYLVLWMQSDAFVGTLDPGRSNGVPHISTKQVASMSFPLPPLAEQSRIVTRVTQLRQLCAELRARLSASQSTQAQLAEALVDSVGSGVPVVT